MVPPSSIVESCKNEWTNIWTLTKIPLAGKHSSGVNDDVAKKKRQAIVGRLEAGASASRELVGG